MNVNGIYKVPTRRDDLPSLPHIFFYSIYYLQANSHPLPNRNRNLSTQKI